MAKRKREKDSYIFRSKSGLIARRIVFVALAILLIPGGYFLAKRVGEGELFPKKQESSVSSSKHSSSLSESGVSGGDSSGAQTQRPDEKSLLAFYLTFEKIKDSEVLSAELDKAKLAGLNAVVFDLKDTEGVLLYASETEMVKQTRNVVSENALTIDEVKTIISTIKSAGFTPVPRIFAFKDHKASWELHSAKITLDTDPAVTWLDNALADGGKAWLNPYAPDAHRYVSEIAAEVSSFGAKAIIIDGIQFPLQTSRANYGKDELVNLSQNDVLKKFVETVEEKVSEGCDIIVSFPSKAVIEGKTVPYGGDPAAFGGSYVSPTVFLSQLGNSITLGDKTVASPRQNITEAVTAIITHFGIRVDVMEKPQPALMPWFEVSGYSKEEISQQVNAARQARNNEISMVFYDPQGSYDFDKIDLN